MLCEYMVHLRYKLRKNNWPSRTRMVCGGRTWPEQVVRALRMAQAAAGLGITRRGVCATCTCAGEARVEKVLHQLSNGVLASGVIVKPKHTSRTSLATTTLSKFLSVIVGGTWGVF